MRVLLPFGSNNKGSNSEATADSCVVAESSTSFVGSSSSRNNLHAYFGNCSEKNDLHEAADLSDLYLTQSSSRTCEKEIASNTAFKSEEILGDFDDSRRKVSLHSRKESLKTGTEAHSFSAVSSSFISSEVSPSLPESDVLLPNTLCSTSPLSTRSFKKRRSATPVQEALHFSQETAVSVSQSCVSSKSKRFRSDRIHLSNSNSVECNMAVGGRFKSDSDDEASFPVEPQDRTLRRFWIQPAENAPPFTMQNHAIVVAPSTSIAQVDGREMPQSSPEEVVRDGCDVAMRTSSDEEKMLARFCELLKKQGLEMVEQEGDGNCLFRAVSLQVYGSSENHSEVRERCMDYMAHEEEHFSGFIVASSDDEVIIRPGNGSVTPFQAYIARKRNNGVHGNHTEIQALSELFNRPVEVYTPGSCVGETGQLQPINIFHKEYKAVDQPIRLSYHDGNHYNAIIDPFVPTAGLGLGLPGLKPGLADQMQITKAKMESDHLADEMELASVLKESREELVVKNDAEFQQVLKESSRDFFLEQKVLALSDLDEADFALEQKALANSMESYYRQEHGRKQRAAVLPTTSSSRRRRGSPSPTEVDTSLFSSVAAVPSPVTGTAAVLPVASSPVRTNEGARSVETDFSNSIAEEYPQVIQELVMNGFELQDVVRAYEFVGDRFDDMLSFLLSSSNTGN